MSRKGGYKILNLSDLFFDTNTSKEVPGIYDQVSALESKVTLISGLDIDDVPQDDMFVTWVNDSGTYKATIGDQTIAVASDDTVLITDGIIGGGGSGPTSVDAEDVTYDNSASELEAENVQGAIDEVAGYVGEQWTRIESLEETVDDTQTANVSITTERSVGEFPKDNGKRAAYSFGNVSDLSVICNNITLTEVRDGGKPIPFTAKIKGFNMMHSTSHSTYLIVSGVLTKQHGNVPNNAIFGVGTAVDEFSGMLFMCRVIFYIDESGSLTTSGGDAFSVEMISPYYTT